MKAIKPILPTLRDKKRYIAYEVITDKPQNLTSVMVKEAINKTLLQVLGVFGYAQAGVMFVKGTTKGIIKVNRPFVDHVKAALLMITHINKQTVIINSTKTSGMINKT